MDIGLELAGFDDSEQGRRSFCSWVDTRRDDRWDLTDEQLLGVHRKARKRLGPAVEIDQPIGTSPMRVPLCAPAGAHIRRPWDGSLERIREAVCTRLAVETSRLLRPGRSREVVEARRVFFVLALAAGYTLTEAAACIAVSRQAASKAVRATDPDILRHVRAIAKALHIHLS